ncbi:putative histidinol-phosphate transaminase [Tilletiaria anomala UBC 951]|uniref:histidinol-phosphate transaminase n=1 Tax=Tilletiaria anomala (strain ATCC 24038 / CBS 436.72 / UBC 951) TaxID=1037660 RepID=A0A066WFM1_TILAU|nr:putative histidinol-phosphate transaminase [Tilletiaria anomala UBC 951]KDN51313.1 putative histidinol-phosphate transaminase [Tilletiaria anomala UBC 951]
MSALQVPGISSKGGAKPSTRLKPPHFKLSSIIRPNILSLQPYRCARDDYQEGILLDANENSLGHCLPEGASVPHQALASLSSSAQAQAGTQNGMATPINGAGAADTLALHRYPDPSLYNIKPRLASLRGVPDDSYVFLGVGSDEVLDLIQRVVGRPGKDKIAICPPTYGMYCVCAAVNDLEVVKIPLRVDVPAGEEKQRFSLDTDKVLENLRADPSIKILFLCSPGNPTGTLLSISSIQRILDFPDWSGLVVVDEAYIDFAEEEARFGARSPTSEVPVSAVELVHSYANVIVTQTLSKAFGLAAIRLGIAYAQPPLIQILNNTKAPYNISVPTAHLASLALSDPGLDKMHANIRTLLANRDRLARDLQAIPSIGPILGNNEANFLLAVVLDRPRSEPGARPDSARAGKVYKAMAEQNGLVVRDRSKELGCDGALRITVGTEEENKTCVELMRELLA